MEQHPERRLCPRYSLPVRMRFQVLDMESDISEKVVECANISRNGLALLTS